MGRYVMRAWLDDRPGALPGVVDRLEPVGVEDVQQVVDRRLDPGADPLELAVELGRQQSPDAVATALASGVTAVFSGDWAAVVRPGDDHDALAVAGQPPPVAWLAAFASGASVPRAQAGLELRGPRDVAWARLEHADATVVVGRGCPPFRGEDRHQLLQLGQIADGRWRELAIRAGMHAHPSGGRGRPEQPAAAS